METEKRVFGSSITYTQAGYVMTTDFSTQILMQNTGTAPVVIQPINVRLLPGETFAISCNQNEVDATRYELVGSGFSLNVITYR